VAVANRPIDKPRAAADAASLVSNLASVVFSSDARYPIAVLVSGTGSNLQAVIDAAEKPTYGAAIVVVISDRPNVFSLQRAAVAGIPGVVVDWHDHRDRESFSRSICDVAETHGARGLVLAGFMRILAPIAIARFPHRIINIHPALLPAFPGADAIDASLAHGVKLSGVTVHFVDEEVDHGPIILQEAVPVHADDTRESLKARLQAVEHRVFPVVVDQFARSLITVVGRVVTRGSL
jgi:phosphoribosylglycinamide formyltransferase-1